VPANSSVRVYLRTFSAQQLSCEPCGEPKDACIINELLRSAAIVEQTDSVARCSKQAGHEVRAIARMFRGRSGLEGGAGMAVVAGSLVRRDAQGGRFAGALLWLARWCAETPKVAGSRVRCCGRFAGALLWQVRWCAVVAGSLVR
jgi:hypothetical protein